MENSLDTNLKNPYGSNTSLLKKIIDIFRPRRGAVLRRIYAGLNSDSVSPSASRTHSQGMFTPHGILDLKLSPAEIITLIESQTISNEERNALITYMKSIETTSDMKTPDNEGVTYASSKDQEPPPKEHYFYAYKYSTKGSWFSTMLYDTPEKAKESLDETGIIRTKLCCVVL
jgi:hypothetical protein